MQIAIVIFVVCTMVGGMSAGVFVLEKGLGWRWSEPGSRSDLVPLVGVMTLFLALSSAVVALALRVVMRKQLTDEEFMVVFTGGKSFEVTNRFVRWFLRVF